LPGFAPPPQHPKPSHDEPIQIGIWWPAADSGKLRAAAHAWRDMAGAIDAVQSATQPTVLSLLAENQGPAMDAFASYWQNWSGDSGYMAACAQACREMAGALDRYAQAVDDARQRVEDLVAEMATAVLIGVVLAPFTATLSVEVAGAVSAGLIASAAAVGVELSVTAIGLATTIVAGVTVTAVEAMTIDAAVIQPERILLFHDQKDFNWNEVWQWGEWGAAGWVGGAALGYGFRTVRSGLSAGRDGAVTLEDGAAIAGEPGPLTWGWPPAMPQLPKPGLGGVGAAEWRYQRYVFDQSAKGVKATDIMDFSTWSARHFDPAVAGGRPGRAGGPPQQSVRQALVAEGYTNVENVQLGERKFVDLVAKNDFGGTDYVEVDEILKRGTPNADLRAKLVTEIAALGPNDRLLFVDKNDLTRRILYLPGDDVESLNVQGSLDRFGVGALQ
jgi:uncharacterized protein YukE